MALKYKQRCSYGDNKIYQFIASFTLAVLAMLTSCVISAQVKVEAHPLLYPVQNSGEWRLPVASTFYAAQFSAQTRAHVAVSQIASRSRSDRELLKLAPERLESRPHASDFHPCTLSSPSLNLSRQLECLTLQAPLDTLGDSASPEQISLSVVRLQARSRNPRKDPLLLLAGGPGQAASEVYLFADSQFQKVSRYRDIYLIDQRGTGRSAGFRCKDVSEDGTTVLAPAAIEKAVNRCLSDFPYDARFFTTAHAIEDLEFVRKALDIPQWNVLGSSYGTRVALQYLRKYPDAVRTAILDSVVYPELNLGLDIAAQSERALQTLIDRCENDSDCNEAFPNIGQGIAMLFSRLSSAPIDIEYEDIKSGRTQAMQFSAQDLALVVRLALYQDELFALLPAMLHEAYANKHYSPLARNVQLYQGSMMDGMYMGMHNSVICSEDFAFYERDAVAEAEAKPSYLGGNLIRSIKTLCDRWPKGHVDADFKAPLISNKPVLLLSGSEDPITPPEYAAQAAKTLNQSLNLVLPGQGHSVSSIGCVPTLIAQFIDSASVKGLDSTCVDSLRSAPFFLNFNGPAP